MIAKNEHNFPATLLHWYDNNGRHDLPWQKKPNAYRVWLSEIMLQQTQVATVIPYYQNFMDHFPTLRSLARADIHQVLTLWSGLGYYARARNLHKTAQIIDEQYRGQFPRTLEELCNLPGIGLSTAGAILSFALQTPATILDGNVKRVLIRYYAIESSLDQKTIQLLWQIAKKHTPSQRCNHYNQAMMDLGALICTRSKPKCHICPLTKNCQAYQNNQQHLLPKRKLNKKQRPLKKSFFIILQNRQGQVLLELRPPLGIWGGLWCLPECPAENDLQEFCQSQLDSNLKNYRELPAFVHHFSHFSLEITPVLITTQNRKLTVMEAPERTWYDLSLSPPGGIAAPIKTVLEFVRTKNDD